MAAILDDPRGMTYGTTSAPPPPPPPLTRIETEEEEDVEILDDDAIAELDACVAEQQDVFSESFAYDGDDGMPPRTADGSSTGQTAVSPSSAAAANPSTFSATSTTAEVVIKRDIPYTADTSIDKLKLDIYIPFSNPLLHQQPSPPPQTDVTASSTTTTKLIPVYFHVHGGGWKRGDRSIRFYGAPGVCHFACRSAGLIAVAPSYRLGHYPTFLHDVVLALKWVIEHIAEYGGDPSSIVLSGHSAGAHIVSLLVLHGDAYGLSLGDLHSRVKGVVLLSGVYSLHAPLDHKEYALRNAIFRRSYIKGTFGTDPEIVDGAAPSCVLWARGARVSESSPVSRKKTTKDAAAAASEASCAGGCFISNLLRGIGVMGPSPSVGDCPPPPFPISGPWAKTFTRLVTGRPPSPQDQLSDMQRFIREEKRTRTEEEEAGGVSASATTATNNNANRKHHLVVVPFPFLVLNASLDFGLETDGRMFAALLSDYVTVVEPPSASPMDSELLPPPPSPPPQVEYHIIAGTNHASLCWAEGTQKRLMEFLSSNAKVIAPVA